MILFTSLHIVLQITDAVDEAIKFINEERDPPWLEQSFINDEIGKD